MNVEHLKKNSRSGKTNTLWIIVALIVLGFVTGAITYSNGQLGFHFGNNGNQNNTTNTTPALSGQNYQVQVSVYDALTGSAETSLSPLKMFLPGQQTNFDSSSSTANPVQFGGTNYKNGGTYWLQIGKSGLATTLTQFNPGGSTPGLVLSGGQTYANLGNAYTVTTPTYALICSWTNGTSFTSSQTYNVTIASQATTQNISCTLKNTAPNTGYISSWNPATQQTLSEACVWNDTNSNQALSITGYPRLIGKGAGAYYPYQVPDGFNVGQSVSPDGVPVTTLYSAISSSSQISASGMTTYQPVSSAAMVGGSYTFSITVNIGSVAHGSSEIVGLSCYNNADINVFYGPQAFYGNFGPTATSVKSLEITVEK